jgi:flavin-dependent dehydrogenase
LRDHDGVVQFLAGKIRENGGSIFEDCKIFEINRKGRYFNVRGGDQIFNARCVVTALGPWAVVGPLARFTHSPIALAYNVVVRRNLQDYTQSGLCGIAQESPSGRLFFLVPRVDGVAIGTGYLEAGSGEMFSEPPMEEIRRFLNESRGLFNWPELSEDEILRIEWGILPVRAFASGGPEFYGSSIVKENESGRFDILSTKYTSFDSTARQVERLVLSRLE